MIDKMSEEESRALLRAQRLARLGCIVEGEPYVVPINYVFNGECLISHSLPGRKLTAMRESPRVCLQVDELEDACHWKSVLVFGTFEEVSGTEARALALNLLLSQFPRLTPVESLIAEDVAAPAPIIYRIRIDRITGVREG